VSAGIKQDAVSSLDRPAYADRSPVLLAGPSCRAAAASALRAGLEPHCLDLFADRDLLRACPCRRIEMDCYPQDLPAEMAKLPAMPYLFLGGLENQGALLDTIQRPRWGMDSAALLHFRRYPHMIAWWLGSAGLRTLNYAASWELAKILPGVPASSWLLKGWDSSAGHRVRHAKPGEPFDAEKQYLQPFVGGMDASAVFVADALGRPRLLGVTRQLIGTPWLRSSGFRYAGNVGPWPVSEKVVQYLESAVRVIAEWIPLRGLFGIDFILRDDEAWIVEFNPRYVASIEVLERATGESFLVHHRAAFDATESRPIHRERAAPFVAKGILYAREALVFPKDGPWDEAFDDALDDLAVPYADIPHPGERIAKGHPILTLFAFAEDADECLERLREKAAFVEDRLFSAAN